MLQLSRFDCLGDALRDRTIMYKSNVALIEADRHREKGRWSYAELAVQAESMAAKLQAAGIEPGERVAILMSNQAKWVMSGLGALWAGAVLVPLDYKLTAPEQLGLLAHCRPRALITEYGIWRSLCKHSADELAETGVQVSEAPAEVDLGGAARWEAPAEKGFTYRARKRNDVACIVYSSGTGGRPKGCMLTHDSYLVQAQELGNLFPMEEHERYFSVLPTNHAIDFMCGMIIPFLYGAAVVHQRTLRPEFLASTMKAHGVTHTALVPRILRNIEQKLREQLQKLPPWQRLLLDGLMTVNELYTAREPDHRISRTLLKPIHDRFGGKLRLVVAGGAFVDPGCVDFLYRLGLPVAIGYGLTEACVVLTVNDLRPFRPETVGRPVPGVEIEIRDANEAGVGEVYARGRSLMKGYLDDAELTAETMLGGWLRTGDLGLIDASGHLKLVGRAKNMVVTAGGKNVYPEDVEFAFEQVESCEELCVFAESFVWSGASPADDRLLLVARPREGWEPERLREDLRRRNLKLAEYKRAASLLQWDEAFPRTATQKVKRQQLAREIAARHAGREALQEL